MVGDEEKEEKQEIKLEPIEKSVSQFAYAVSRIKKHKSETFDLMAEKAIEFYLSKESKDLSGQIIHAIQALFYFVAFAIAHPKLTHNLRVSLEALGDPKQPNAAKEFAVQVIKDKGVWDQIVNNETLKPYLIKLGKGLIKSAGLPFPSYKEMERKYIKEQKAAGHPNPRYIPSLYIRTLMRMEIEGFEKEPKIGTLEYKAKREYIIGILRDRDAYAEILDDKKVLDTVLSTAQAIVTNEKVNNAILNYVNAPETVPLYKEMERKYIEEQKNVGNPNPVYTPILYIEALMGMGIEGFEKEPKIDTPEYKEKLEYITGILRDRAAHKEALDDKKVLEAALKIAQDTVTNEAAHANAPKKVVKASIIPSKVLPIIEAVLSEEVGFEVLEPLLDQIPDIVDKIPAIKDAVPDFIDINEMHKELLKGDNGKETFTLASKVFEQYDGVEAVYAGYQISVAEGNAAVVELLKNQGVDLIWTALTAHPTLIPYASKVIQAYFDKNASLDFNERKALYDAANEAPPYTEAMYKKEQEAAEAAALSVKEYLVVLNDFAQNPEPIDIVIQAVQDIMADDAVSIEVIGGLLEPEAAAINHAKHLVDNMGMMAHYAKWMQAKEAADKAQGLPAVEYTQAMYIEETLTRKESFLATLNNPEYGVAAARHILATNSIDGLNYVPVKVLPENELLPTFAISLIRAMLDKGVDALDPLLAQLPIIANKIPAIQRALPGYIKLEELTEALLGDIGREGTFFLISTIFSHYSRLEKIYSAEDPLKELVEFVKTGALDALLVQLTNHPTLMPYVVNVVNGYINAMDMSKPGGDNTAMVVSLLGHATLWDQVISNTALRPHIVSIAETYLNKVANMSFDERKAGYDRAHKDDKPAAPAYTQGMYDQDKAAAMSGANTYLSLLRDDATVNEIVGLGKFVLTEHNQDILGYLSAPKKEGELLPSALIPIIKALIDGDKLEPLLGKLEVIFRTLAPDNFAPNAPEFGVGIMDKSLLNLIFELLDPSKKVEFYKLLSTVVGELNKILAEFSKKVIVDGVEKNVPFFAALGGIVDVVSKNTVLKNLIEASPGTISKIIHYVVRKNFNQYCIQYGIQDKFWGVLDIAFKDLSAVRSLLVGLQEITNGANYKNKDGSFNGQGTEKAVDTFIRELVKLLNHPVIGKPLRHFVRDNKEVFVSLIDGVLNNIPAAKPYITDYVLGLGLTFSDVLDQLVHNPNDIIKLWDVVVDIGLLRGEASIGRAKTVLENKWTKGEGLGVYSPVFQQVVAEVAKPYVPQVVVDWTPQWFKNYVPGGAAVGDRRGAGFGKWVWRNINITPQELNTNLHDVLVAKSKIDKEVTDEAREFINYNALAKLNFGDEALMLNRYLVEGFSFSGSQASEVYMTKSEVKKSNFKGFGAKEFFINNSKVDEVKFDGAKLDKLVFKEGAVVSNTSFKDVRVRELTISNSELTNVDFTGLKFETEVSGWLYGKSVVANPNAVLTIRNSTIDKASLANLEAAAKVGGFKLELDDRVKIVEQPAKKEPVVVVLEGEKLWEKCSKECADNIIAHLKTVKDVDSELGRVEDKDLREFLEGVMQHAFSNMPQENLMHLPQMNMHGLYSVLQNDGIIRSLESVYKANDNENKVEFTKEVRGVIETFCSKERVLIEERDKIAPRESIKPQEERRKEVGSETRNL